jgi:hypothetical protein
MKELSVILCDAKRVKQLEQAQRVFRKNKNSAQLSDKQRLKVKEGLGKVSTLLKGEKRQRSSVLAKLRHLRAELKVLRETKPEGWRGTMVKIKRKANKTSMYWYGRPMYKSVLPKTPKSDN